MVNLGPVTRQWRDLFKFGSIRKWLNMAGLLSKVIYGSFLQFFSHTGQIHEAFKIFVREQIRAKLEHFEGEVKRSKVRSYMNWRAKRTSAAIVKTASRNVAFKVAKMREAIMEDQDEFLMRTSDQMEAGLERANATFLEDAAQNADLYIANQNVSMQI